VDSLDISFLFFDFTVLKFLSFSTLVILFISLVRPFGGFAGITVGEVIKFVTRVCSHFGLADALVFLAQEFVFELVDGLDDFDRLQHLALVASEAVADLAGFESADHIYTLLGIGKNVQLDVAEFAAVIQQPPDRLEFGEVYFLAAVGDGQGLTLEIGVGVHKAQSKLSPDPT